MNKTIIVTIHGILTNIDESDSWQAAFRLWLNKAYSNEVADGTLVQLPFSYGMIGPIWAFILNTMAWAGLARFVSPFATRRFKKFLQETAKNYPEYEIHIVAHSFGTWVTQESLEEVAGRTDVCIKSLHLFGAVISAHIQRNYLDEFLMSKQLGYCVVWSSHNDTVVRYLAVPPFGHAGYWGIIRDYHPEDRTKPIWQPYDYLQLYNRTTEAAHDGSLVVQNFPTIMGDILNGPKA